MENITLKVLGMSCSHCEHAIKQAVGELDGVETVAVDLPNGEVSVTFEQDKVELDKIISEIEDAGYDVEK